MTEVKAQDGTTYHVDTEPNDEQAATNEDHELRLVQEEELSDEWLAIVDEALEDLRAGRFIPYKEMKKELNR